MDEEIARLTRVGRNPRDAWALVEARRLVALRRELVAAAVRAYRWRTFLAGLVDLDVHVVLDADGDADVELAGRRRHRAEASARRAHESQRAEQPVGGARREA